MHAPSARWLAVVLGLSTSACSFLIDAPEARYAASTQTDASQSPGIDAAIDAEPQEDGEVIEDAAADADTLVDSATDPEACNSHAQCEARLEECRVDGFCNLETKRCEDRMADDCTPCSGPLGTCVAGECLPGGVIYSFDFESALGSEWTTTTPNRPWTLTSSQATLRSPNVAMSSDLQSDGTSSLELTVPNVPDPARIRFWARVRGDSFYDTLDLLVRRASEPPDESVQIRELAAGQGWNPVDELVRAHGDLVFTWRYHRRNPGDVESSESLAFIDDVSIVKECD